MTGQGRGTFQGVPACNKPPATDAARRTTAEAKPRRHTARYTQSVDDSSLAVGENVANVDRGMADRRTDGQADGSK